jgi:hypothetical protein
MRTRHRHRSQEITKTARAHDAIARTIGTNLSADFKVVEQATAVLQSQAPVTARFIGGIVGK